MSRYIDPFTQYFLNNGDMNADGLLYFYENLDYLTPKATYNLNGDLNSNPVVLDGSGRIPEIQGDGLYSIVLKSSSGVTQKTVDNYNMSTGSSTPDLTSPTVVGDMTFATASSRIKGDLSNATVSSRLLIQTSVMNSTSSLGIMPSGTAQSSSLQAYNSSSPNSASVIGLTIGSGTASIVSSRTGAGTYLPLDFLTSGAQRLRVDVSGNFVPLTDNGYSIGQSGFRFSALWAANGTIQTSDERTKTEISESVLGLDFINALEPVSYKFKVGKNVVVPSKIDGGQPTVIPVAGERTHWGLKAQQVKAVADAAGVDFGGHIITDMTDPNSQQGLRYDEFIAPLIKAIQELTARIEELEAP